MPNQKHHDHPAHHPETLAAKVVGPDVGRVSYAGVLLRGLLGTDEDAGGRRRSATRLPRGNRIVVRQR